MKIVLVGAGSSVGRHLLRNFPDEFVGIYRGAKALSQLCDLDLDHRLVKCSSTAEMTAAFSGADAVVTLVNDESPTGALGSLKDVLAACEGARVPQLIHMSSASIFGNKIDGNAPIDNGGPALTWNTYAAGKQWQENAIKRARHRPPSTVVLRPGLIWGPGMAWLHMPASEVVRGDAWAVNKSAPCNLVNINFLAHSIRELVHLKPNGLSFVNVRDADTYSWVDYYNKIGEALDTSVEVNFVSAGGAAPWKKQPGRLRSTFPVGLGWSVLPKPIKNIVKKVVKAALPKPKSGLVEIVSDAAEISINREVWELKTTNALPQLDSITVLLQKSYPRNSQVDWEEIRELRGWLFV